MDIVVFFTPKIINIGQYGLRMNFVGVIWKCIWGAGRSVANSVMRTCCIAVLCINLSPPTIRQMRHLVPTTALNRYCWWLWCIPDWTTVMQSSRLSTVGVNAAARLIYRPGYRSHIIDVPVSLHRYDHHLTVLCFLAVNTVRFTSTVNMKCA